MRRDGLPRDAGRRDVLGWPGRWVDLIRWLASILMALGAGGRAMVGESASPVGEWRTIDDRTQQPNAIVQIVDWDWMLYGVVEKGLVSNPAH